MLMVKPGMPYLDIVREVKDKVSRRSRDQQREAQGNERVCPQALGPQTGRLQTLSSEQSAPE